MLRERERGRGGGGEKHQSGASRTCPDWGWKPKPRQVP